MGDQTLADAAEAKPSATPHDVADLLNCSVRTVQRLALGGQLPSYRAGTQLRFDISEVLAATRATRSA